MYLVDYEAPLYLEKLAEGVSDSLGLEGLQTEVSSKVTVKITVIKVSLLTYTLKKMPPFTPCIDGGQRITIHIKRS
jgi:hypothetical protein